ncbi:META domain-containing protein [Marinilabiliaceae bacterium JC017]|nr:META domain-containing protein [Marinilabiliaceae bacterium JC017]
MTKLTSLFYLVFLYSLSCTDNNNPFIIHEMELDATWNIQEVTAPSFPVKGVEPKSGLAIKFKPDETYMFKMTTDRCYGKYETSKDKTLEISRPGCSKDYCDFTWDWYVATLLDKVTRFTIDDDKIVLIIDDKNFITAQKEASK